LSADRIIIRQYSDKDLHKICTIANFGPVRIQYKTWLLMLLLVFTANSRTVQKNISIIEQETAAVWDSLCSVNLPDSADLIIDTGIINGEKKFFLNAVFLNSMSTAGGWKVNTKTGRYKLVIDEFDVRIMYYEKTERLTGFSKKLQRYLEIKLKGRLEDIKSGSVISVDQSSRVIRNEFDSANIEKIEQSGYSFSRGSHKTFSRWSRFLEPGIAVLSVTAMIYLLFSVRF